MILALVFSLVLFCVGLLFFFIEKKNRFRYYNLDFLRNFSFVCSIITIGFFVTALSFNLVEISTDYGLNKLDKKVQQIEIIQKTIEEIDSVYYSSKKDGNINTDLYSSLVSLRMSKTKKVIVLNDIILYKKFATKHRLLTLSLRKESDFDKYDKFLEQFN